MRLGDVGIPLRLTVVDESGVAIDISSATTKQILFKAPGGGDVTTQSANFTTDGSDGKIEFVSTALFPDEKGKWRYQAYVIDSGQEYHTGIAKFDVLEVLA